MFDYLINSVMIPFLTYSYNNVFPNYGVAIILLTIVVKVIFYPLTKKQFEAMKVNQMMQPKLKELQEKYKKQPEILQKKMVEMWKDHKVNPLSGCLPMLVQLPFFIAIFMTMQSPAFKTLIAQPGINPGLFPFWLPNLGLADVTFILPIIIAISTYWSQKSMPMDANQAKIFMFMPILMFVISWKMPSGVLLYWAVSTILSTVQQMWIMKKIDEKPAHAQVIELETK
jgi:YidC/Oxa1 family membrane protein insertase